MKIKKSDLYFYEMLRDFLHKYLVVQRNFTEATVKNYTDSLISTGSICGNRKASRLIRLDSTASARKWYTISAYGCGTVSQKRSTQ